MNIPVQEYTQDTLGEGIPDFWKRRTYAPRDVPIAHLDRDNDGLSELEEFLFGSDPRTYSTRGDHWSDKEKRDNGLEAWFKVTSPVAFSNWLAWANLDAQGWDAATGTGAWGGFTGTYGNFVHSTPPYSTGEGTVDFWLEMRMDRHALLTVGDALTTNSFPVRAGTSRVRIRAALGAPVTLTMDPAPGTLADIPGATNGLWLCDMAIKPYRTNTVVFTASENPSPPPGEHDFVDGILILEQPTGTVHRVSTEQSRNVPSVFKPTIEAQPLSMGKRTLLGADGWYCVPCGQPPYPCDWPTYGMLGIDPVTFATSGLNANNHILPVQAAQELINNNWPFVCTVTQIVFNATYTALYSTVVFKIGACGVYQGVWGVELPWYPSHAPNYYAQTSCLGIGCTCRGGPAWHVGFDHAKVKTRNLSVITNHTEEAYQKTEHCLGVVWRPGSSNTNLLSLLHLDDLTPDILTNLHFTANGVPVTSPTVFSYGIEPKDMEPTIYNIELRHRQMGDTIFDRLWITVNSRATYTSYTNWVAANKTNMTWTLTLPPAFDSIDVSGKLVSPGPKWKTPTKCDSYLHHDAAYDARSAAVANGHGHQACYNAKGILITEGVAAGTADLVSPSTWRFAGHREQDVEPFIRALQLDGNPCLRNFSDAPTNLKRPMMYQGHYLNQYLECRPAIPTGTQSRP